jgi:hypothetical protein
MPRLDGNARLNHGGLGGACHELRGTWLTMHGELEGIEVFNAKRSHSLSELHVTLLRVYSTCTLHPGHDSKVRGWPRGSFGEGLTVRCPPLGELHKVRRGASGEVTLGLGGPTVAARGVIL